jgi:hypothetical protein
MRRSPKLPGTSSWRRGVEIAARPLPTRHLAALVIALLAAVIVLAVAVAAVWETVLGANGSGAIDMQAADKPEHEENDQYQAESAA